MIASSRTAMIGLALAAGCFDDPAGGPHPCDSCRACESCVEGPDGPACAAASQQTQTCVGDEIHWLDSCGDDEGPAETCPAHSTCEDDGAGAATCVCTNEWTGADCDVCPGNWDPAQDCAACETNWEGGDCETCPGNWDPATNCDTCANHWIDLGDDCGTCPANWDPVADCDGCLGNWDVGTGCEECLGNYDEAADCDACANHWVDDGDGCGTCPANWDPAADCDACLNHWIDEGNDCATCPGNWDATAACNLCVGNFDPASDCAACFPGWVGPECDVQPACVRYVDIDSTASSPSGHAWLLAFADVQDAVDSAAAALEAPAAPEWCEVWIAEGVYYLYESTSLDTVSLAPNVHLYGGFAGDEAALADRDWVEHPTVLDGRGSSSGEDRVYHVVVGAEAAVLDGLEIRYGYAAGASSSSGTSNSGGGLLVSSCAMTVLHCAFSENDARFGGAIAAIGGGAATISASELTDNYATTRGGAIYAESASVDLFECAFSFNETFGDGGAAAFVSAAASIDESTFSENEAIDDGGAIAAYGGTMALYSSQISGNVSGWNGAGVSFANNGTEESGDAFVAGVVFTGNSSDHYGGGAYVWSSGAVVFKRCVFSSNAALRGGGAAAFSPATPYFAGSTFYGNDASWEGGGFWGFSSEMAALLNDVFWNNTPEQILGTSATIWVGYSDVQGGYAGTGNIDDLPQFVDADAADFRLSASSPCIDAGRGASVIDLGDGWTLTVGTDTIDILGNPMVDDPATANIGAGTPNYIDIGAFEYQP